jgi:hypothetical protein
VDVVGFSSALVRNFLRERAECSAPLVVAGRAMSWLRRTGQRWKLVVFWLGMLGPWVLGRLGVSRFEDDWFVLALAVFVWFLFAVRCPRCGGRPVWALANGVDHRQFDRALLGARECPLCHDGVEQPPPPPPLFSAYRGM